MKKLLAILLVLVMIFSFATVFTACGDDDYTYQSNDDDEEDDEKKDPSDPSDPADPSDPSDPSTPNQPEDPTEPSTPNQPENPTQPSTPNQPEDPTQPSTPSQPEEPVEPDTPDQPEDPKPQPPATTNKLVGTWKGSLDVAPVLSMILEMEGDSLDSSAQMFLEFMEFSPNNLSVTVQFNSDNTCSLSFDKTNLANVKAILTTDVENALYAFLNKMIQENHMPMTADQLAQVILGGSVKQIVAEMMSSVDLSELEEPIAATYTVSGNEISVKANEDTQDMVPDRLTYTVNGNQLKFSVSAGEEDAESFNQILNNITFYRQ